MRLLVGRQLGDYFLGSARHAQEKRYWAGRCYGQMDALASRQGTAKLSQPTFPRRFADIKHKAILGLCVCLEHTSQRYPTDQEMQAWIDSFSDEVLDVMKEQQPVQSQSPHPPSL